MRFPLAMEEHSRPPCLGFWVERPSAHPGLDGPARSTWSSPVFGFKLSHWRAQIIPPRRPVVSSVKKSRHTSSCSMASRKVPSCSPFRSALGGNWALELLCPVEFSAMLRILRRVNGVADTGTAAAAGGEDVHIVLVSAVGFGIQAVLDNDFPLGSTIRQRVRGASSHFIGLAIKVIFAFLGSLARFPGRRWSALRRSSYRSWWPRHRS